MRVGLIGSESAASPSASAARFASSSSRSRATQPVRSVDGAAASANAANVRSRSPAVDAARSACAGDLRGRVTEVHDLRVAETPEAEPEVERRPRDEHEVGFLQRERPRARERELVVGRERAAAHAVDERRHPRGLDERPQRALRAGPVHVAPRDQRRPARRGHDFRDLRERVGIRRVAARRAVDRRQVDVGRTERVERDVEERRARGAVSSRRGTTASSSATIDSPEVAVTARLVTGATIGTWSSSCSEPEPHRPCGARPPSTTTGEPFIHAAVIALTPLVTPGPAVIAAQPRRRVTFAQPSAANVAVCSWRTSISRKSACTAPS